MTMRCRLHTLLKNDSCRSIRRLGQRGSPNSQFRAFANNSTDFGNERPFDKILIANRGEIACRVIRTCQRLGVKTVAVYSDADTYSMHVQKADEAYWIGSSLSKDSYLRMDRILEIALKTGAQAIHPGYGFLSENGKFVDMVEEAGLAFIGPSSAPMHSMGDKISSKVIAKEAGCFVIPGYEGEVESEDDAVRLANDVGYPVMIKASAGGGGKGMRVAYTDAEVKEGFRLSKAEAMSSFGDDRMLIERFVENPHHIEIQVLADIHGNVVAFPERECSVQRRNQKVVEESPSCLLTPETRLAMQQQAQALCLATGYRSAGTVEMLADDQQNFYFLEMNTRLQVEHPITELVTGEDLVEHMLWIAAGKPLPARLTSLPNMCLPFNGNAIESRVYAEDPFRGFLPSIGPLLAYKEPPIHSSPASTVRIDTGVTEGATISQFYDPMISKLCTHSTHSREHAIAMMSQALDRYVIQGLGNNLPFLRSVMRNRQFQSGSYSTSFIEDQYPEGRFEGVVLNRGETIQLVATAAAIHQARHEHHNADRMRNYHLEQMRKGPSGELEEDLMEDRLVVVLGDRGPLGGGPAFHCLMRIQDTLDVTVTPLAQDFSDSADVSIANLEWQSEELLAKVTFLEGEDEEEGEREGEGEVEVEVREGEEDEILSDSVQYLSHFDTHSRLGGGGQKTGHGPGHYLLRFRGSEQRISVLTEREWTLYSHMLPPEPEADSSKMLLCPMPGTLVSVSVEVGQVVQEGQELAVVEAMKMQNVLRAARKGVVKAVLRGPESVGANLRVDEIIMEFE